MIDNKINVLINKNKSILKFDKCDLETTSFIGKNGATINKQEGDDCTPIGEFELGLILGTHDEICNKNVTNHFSLRNKRTKKYNKKLFHKMLHLQQ